MHKELAKNGLVIITLSVDEEDNEKTALDFLQKMKAPFSNYILSDKDEAKDKLEKTLQHKLPPIYHVFDRAGKKIRTFEEVKDDEFDKYVKDLLNQK
jgi:hypothetical protein